MSGRCVAGCVHIFQFVTSLEANNDKDQSKVASHSITIIHGQRWNKKAPRNAHNSNSNKDNGYISIDS